jgi:hypothetical protein
MKPEAWCKGELRENIHFSVRSAINHAAMVGMTNHINERSHSASRHRYV